MDKTENEKILPIKWPSQMNGEYRDNPPQIEVALLISSLTQKVEFGEIQEVAETYFKLEFLAAEMERFEDIEVDQGLILYLSYAKMLSKTRLRHFFEDSRAATIKTPLGSIKADKTISVVIKDFTKIPECIITERKKHLEVALLPLIKKVLGAGITKVKGVEITQKQAFKAIRRE